MTRLIITAEPEDLFAGYEVARAAMDRRYDIGMNWVQSKSTDPNIGWYVRINKGSISVRAQRKPT